MVLPTSKDQTPLFPTAPGQILKPANADAFLQSLGLGEEEKKEKSVKKIMKKILEIFKK